MMLKTILSFAFNQSINTFTRAVIIVRLEFVMLCYVKPASSCKRNVSVRCRLQTLVSEITADATLVIRMLRFDNPSSTKYSGGDCDFFGAGPCDPAFRFSLDRGNRCRVAPENLDLVQAVKMR